jgi:hypothetical protein
MDYNWESFKTSSSSASLRSLVPGEYEIEVIAYDALGRASAASSYRQIVAPQEKVPSNPEGVSIVPIDQYIGVLSWTRSNDLQVLIGGQVLIYHQSVLSSASWDSSVELIKSVSGAQSSAIVPLLEGTYLVKFSTNQNVRSSSFAASSIVLPQPFPVLEIATIQESLSSFSGSKSGIEFNVSKNGLVLLLDTTFDSSAPDGYFDNLPSIDYLGGVKNIGEYIFSNTVDAGGICDVNFKRKITVDPYNIAVYFDDNVAGMDTWGDFDANDVTEANAAVYVRASDQPATTNLIDSYSGNIDTWTDFDSGFATWGEWKPCTNTLLRGRVFQFKAALTSEQANQNIVIKELEIKATLSQRVEESSSPIASGAITYQVNFTNNFHSAPAISITPIQSYQGDYYTISSVTNSGFQVTFYDSGANVVSRTFNYMAVGYGRRI